MGHMTQADWDAHEKAINDYHEDAFQQDVIWKRLITNLSINGEDGAERSNDITLKGLIVYNFFRSWPMNKPDTTGEIDQESCVLYLNNKYLNDNGYLNINGQFNFKPVEDRFIINGVIYKPSGDAQISQTNYKTLLHFVILKREEIFSQENKY